MKRHAIVVAVGDRLRLAEVEFTDDGLAFILLPGRRLEVDPNEIRLTSAPYFYEPALPPDPA